MSGNPTTVRKLINKGIHLLCVFSTYIKRRPCYSSTKYATTVVVFLAYSSTRYRYILTLIHKKTHTNTILTMGNSTIWHAYYII